MPTTTDPAEKLQAIAEAIAWRLGSISGLNVYDHERPDAVGLVLPAACVGAVDVARRGMEEPEDQLSTDDWLTTWALTLYVDLQGQEPAAAMSAARSLVGEVVAVLDSDRNLGGEVTESRLVEAQMGFNDQSAQRRLVVCECEFQAKAWMPT